MDGKEAIIKRIISDAEKKASALIKSATEESESRIADADEWAEEYRKTQREFLQKDAAETVKRRLSVAELDVRKIILKEKQAVVEKVFNEAYAKLCALKKSDYLSLVERLMSESADEGDEIVLSCDKVLSATDVEKMKVFSDKKLKVGGVGDFIGGVMLIGKICDKNLCFKAVVDGIRDDLSAKVAESLFGE